MAVCGELLISPESVIRHNTGSCSCVSIFGSVVLVQTRAPPLKDAPKTFASCVPSLSWRAPFRAPAVGKSARSAAYRRRLHMLLTTTRAVDTVDRRALPPVRSGCPDGLQARVPAFSNFAPDWSEKNLTVSNGTTAVSKGNAM
jgi:hypothetical protein